MRFQSKLFLTSGSIVLVLWAATLYPIQRTISGSFDRLADSDFAASRQSLNTLRMERIGRMGEAGRLVMQIPELRALIAESGSELSPDNLQSLQERLNNLADLLQLQFICVLDGRASLVAQNVSSPWPKLDDLKHYMRQTPPVMSLLRQIYNPSSTPNQYGLWTWQNHLYQVVALPLIFAEHPQSGAPPDGALIMATQMTDDLAAALAPSHRCDITFISGGASMASSLPLPLRTQLLKALKPGNYRISRAFDLTLNGSTYRSFIEPLTDPCSGQTIGNTIIQSSMSDGEGLEAEVSRNLLFIMTAGLAAAAILSFLVSNRITQPVRDLAGGVRRVAAGDLVSTIQVRANDELGELAKAFNDMVTQLRSRTALERQMQEAQAASRAKGEFLATMSHEIRTPLNGVIGMTDLLLGTELTERQRRYAALVKSSAELLTNLINDILDFSKIEAGRMELECIDFDIQETVEDVLDLLASRAGQKGVEISCHFAADVQRQVRGDPDRLRQVIVNLVNNAIKFTPSGSIVLRASAEPAGAGQVAVRIEITDTGIGIPADRQDRLFKSFSQIDPSTTRKFGGTGLGLAISRQLVELMGGKIGVRSEDGRGSTFWFTVKLAAPASPRPQRTLPDLRNLRVLAVDDSASTRGILLEQLASWNFSAVGAATAAEAITTLRGTQPDQAFKLALIDLDMPGTSGLELARAVKSDSKLRDVTLIALTSIAHAAETRAAEFAGEMTKPVHQSRLLDTIMNALAGPKTPAGGQAAPLSAAAPARQGGQGGRGRILIAEDNEVNQLVAVELLTDAGFQCDVVANGRKALEARFAGNFDLILMDCQMPEMDGLEATREIRRREFAENKPRIRIIALTANAVKGDREDCLAAGMDSYCSKPIDAQKLLALIDSLHAPSAAPKAPATVASTETGAPIAVESLLARCMNNVKTVRLVLEKFQAQARQDIEQILESISRKDAPESARLSHALKGAAATISAARLAKIAAELEQLSRANQLDQLEAHLSELKAAADECLAFVPAALAQAVQQIPSTTRGKP